MFNASVGCAIGIVLGMIEVDKKREAQEMIDTKVNPYSKSQMDGWLKWERENKGDEDV
tara:strand:+ start:1544 stop:1717 length:174 start_codon:yes stop_codon:yes gene_type:complete